MKLPKDRDDPIKRDYRPELDESEELDNVDAAYFQSLWYDHKVIKDCTNDGMIR